MLVEIPVEEQDMKNGKRMNADSCPIVLAIKRVLKVKKVKVSVSSIFINNLYFINQPETTNFVYKYDFKKNPKPFVLRLEVRGWHGP